MSTICLGSTGWGRSELAVELYDEILFNGATFGDPLLRCAPAFAFDQRLTW